MSAKRKAIKDLNHDNWDQEDSPAEEEQNDEKMGPFKTASKEVLEKRVIRTAKRRAPLSSFDESKKTVFSGFGGFNKTQPSSYDFLSNLTNGKSSNQTTIENSSTSLFGNKSVSSSPITNAFTIPVVTSSSKSPFGTFTTQSSIFGGTSTGTSVSPFSLKAATTTSSTSATSTLNSHSTSFSNTSPFQSTPSIFGTTSTSLNTKPLFSSSESKSPIQNKPTISTSSIPQTSFGTTTPTSSIFNSNENKSDSKSNDGKKLIYHAKLQGLNESVSEWIKKHVDESPVCILTPIFRDYEKYLKEIQDEYHSKDTEESKNLEQSDLEKKSSDKKIFEYSNNKLETSLPKNEAKNSNSTSIFADQNKSTNVLSSNVKTDPNACFSFGISTAASSNTSSLFSFTANTSNPNTNGSAPFSFGTAKPFTFNSNIQKPPETQQAGNEEEDEPPKVECAPIVEENSVFEKRCKVFVKKDGNFVDKGIGNLYVKKIVESGKHQLLVRANTNLGNVLMNMILSSNIPIQRMGKNNVMLVCIPTPEAEPPPTPVLIRVKTSEEADELLETLNKFKT